MKQTAFSLEKKKKNRKKETEQYSKHDMNVYLNNRNDDY